MGLAWHGRAAGLLLSAQSRQRAEGMAACSDSELRHVKSTQAMVRARRQSGSAGHDIITCHLAVEFERQVIFFIGQ